MWSIIWNRFESKCELKINMRRLSDKNDFLTVQLFSVVIKHHFWEWVRLSIPEHPQIQSLL